MKVASVSRPASASSAARLRQTGRVAAAGTDRRVGRGEPAPTVRHHRSGRGGFDFSHLGEIADSSGSSADDAVALAAGLSAGEIDTLWAEAFRRAGVDLGAGSAGKRGPGRTQGQWDRALVKAGLIKASF